MVAVPIDVSSLSETTDKTLFIDLVRQGVQADQPLPTVRVTIEAEMTSVRFKNVPVRVTGASRWAFLPSSVTILARGPVPLISKMDRELVRAHVRVDPPPSAGSELSVQVELPAGFEVIRVLPDRVKVITK